MRLQDFGLALTLVFSYPEQENPTGSVVLDFLSGTVCLVPTSDALVLSLFAWLGHENYNPSPGG